MNTAATPVIQTWDQGRLRVAAEYAGLMQRNGLTTLDAVFNHPVDKEINNHRKRPVFRIGLQNGDTTDVLYLKRYAHPELKNSLKPLLHGKGPMSMAGREWTALQALLKAGIGTMVPVALGEDFTLGLEKRSFLLTAEVPNLQPLNEFLDAAAATLDKKSFSSFKRRMLLDTADLTRRMHAANFIHGDYYTKHIMVQGDVFEYKLFLLDLQRAETGRPPSRTDIARELAGLLASARLDLVSPADRLRFYLAYLGEPKLRSKDRRLLDKIDRRLQRLLARKKFKGFQGKQDGLSWRRAQ